MMTPLAVYTTGPAPAGWNMSVDEALLRSASKSGTAVLRLYAWSEPAATFGYFQRYEEVRVLTPLRPLVRRPTGGGIVPHDNDWTYSLAFPIGHPWYALRAAESYRQVHEWIQCAFQRCGVETTLAPCCAKTGPGQCFAGYEQHDLLWHGRKIAGAAQRRTRDGLLIQGSVQNPERELQRERWEEALRDCAATLFEFCCTEFHPSSDFLKEAEVLNTNTYGTREYNRRR